MIDPIFHSDNYQLARNLLDASVLRQEAIASNIANAETPGYRRVDVAGDFAAQLRTRLEAGTLADRTPGFGPRLVEDPNARTVRPDGTMTLTTVGPRPNEGQCPVAEEANYSGQVANNVFSARAEEGVDCPGPGEGPHTFNYVMTAYKNTN